MHIPRFIHSSYMVRQVFQDGFTGFGALEFANNRACFAALRLSTVLEAEIREYIFLWIVLWRWLQASFAIGQEECALFVWRMRIMQYVAQAVLVTIDSWQ